jgi:hypothetical protein
MASKSKTTSSSGEACALAGKKKPACGERMMQGPICKGRYQGQVGNVVVRSKMVFTGFTEDWSSPATAL